MEHSRTCEVCNVNVHRASFVKHLRSKKHLENIEQNEMIIPDCLFKEEQATIKKQIKNIYNSRTLQQLARNALIDKLYVVLANHNKNFVFRRCLNSYTCENALINLKEKCGDDNICTMRKSNESHLYWKKTFSLEFIIF